MNREIDAIADMFPPTRLLFREDAYRIEAEATVLGMADGLLVLDQTLFYAASGGQPADHGQILLASGESMDASEIRFLDAGKTRIGHALPPGMAAPLAGERVRLTLDWARRYRLMRMHTALHLLSVVLPYPVTGGAVNPDDGRLDFDIPEAGLDRAAIEAELNRLIATDAMVTDRAIAEAELDANPALVKTMSVKPPRGTGTVRLVEIGGTGDRPLDCQPCGGTHVRRTGEIGRMAVTAVEKKGKQNRRVRIAVA